MSPPAGQTPPRTDPSRPRRARVRKADYWSAAEIVTVLDGFYHRPPHVPSDDPMTELVLTLLSQHTSDHNSGHAMHRLLARFPDWDAIVDADVGAVEDAIRPGGLAPTKSKRLQALLAEVRERRPDYDLHMLRDLPTAEAKTWLTSLPGVGPKTAACVLLFALNVPALPVDTHVERVAKRLGLIAPKMTAVRAHTALEALVPPQDIYAFHMDLIQHGRRTCHARAPRCAACPLLDRCPRVGLRPLAAPASAADPKEADA